MFAHYSAHNRKLLKLARTAEQITEFGLRFSLAIADFRKYVLLSVASSIRIHM